MMRCYGWYNRAIRARAMARSLTMPPPRAPNFSSGSASVGRGGAFFLGRPQFLATFRCVTLRSGHGDMRDHGPRIEVLPADELPRGVSGVTVVDSDQERRPNGRFAPGVKGAPGRGGAAGRGRARLTVRLGMSGLPSDNAFQPYRRSATTLRRVQCNELARSVGGGQCGPMAAAMVTSGALLLAWSRYFSDKAALATDLKEQMELVMRAARLSETSRQHMLAAWEVTAREAQSRPKKAPDVLGAFRASVRPEAPWVDEYPGVGDTESE